ncbi:hypothetical protein GCM10010404_39270 [Nonomuraea africana]|uniref:Membrane protein YagU involved in acid resistance n=1 Tax=Nonomuraea africana TaxID=46171 RepID=A0ABR9KW17_9ACTN|nr:hypothetical protein [Nonomuraea africana]MBE1565935.1 putative membrane protein YagU involved in acid resistance [Nonomuraea africana]
MAAEPLPGRLTRGAIGGLVSGMVFAGATMWFSSTMPNGKAEMPLHMIASIVQGGKEAIMAGQTSVGVGLAVHAALSIVFGVVFGLVTPMLRTNGTVALVGTVYGGLIYVVNFLILSPLLFPVFGDANQPFELFAHLVFGTLLSFSFYGSGVRRNEGFLAIGSAERAPAR